MIRTGYGRGYDLGIFGSIFGHNVTQNLPVLGIQTLTPANNFDTVFTLAQGPTPLNPGSALASQPKGPNGFPLLPNGVTPFVISKRLRLPTVDAWNFTVQRQLTGSLSLEAAYVGNKGTHVFAGTGGDYDPNQATIAGFGTLSPNQRKPYLQQVRLDAEPPLFRQRRQQQLQLAPGESGEALLPGPPGARPLHLVAQHRLHRHVLSA